MEGRWLPDSERGWLVIEARDWDRLVVLFLSAVVGLLGGLLWPMGNGVRGGVGICVGVAGVRVWYCCTSCFKMQRAVVKR